MHQSRGHGIDDQQKQNDADTEEEVAERARDVFPVQPFVANAMLIQPAVGHEPVIQAFAVMEHFCLRYAAGKNHGVQREFLDAEMRVEKLNREKKARRQQRLVRVTDELGVQEAAWQE